MKAVPASKRQASNWLENGVVDRGPERKDHVSTLIQPKQNFSGSSMTTNDINPVSTILAGYPFFDGRRILEIVREWRRIKTESPANGGTAPGDGIPKNKPKGTTEPV